MELVYELLWMAKLLNSIRCRHHLVALKEFKLAHKRLHSLHVKVHPLRVHQLEHFVCMLDLLRDVFVFACGLPVANEMVDEVNALLQRSQLDQCRHVVLCPVNNKCNTLFISNFGWLRFKLFHDFEDFKVRLGPRRLVRRQLDCKLVSRHNRFESIGPIDHVKLLF